VAKSPELTVVGIKSGGNDACLVALSLTTPSRERVVSARKDRISSEGSSVSFVNTIFGSRSCVSIWFVVRCR